MNPNTYILKLLKNIANVGNATVKIQLIEINNSVRLMLDDVYFIEVSENAISLNHHNIMGKISSHNRDVVTVIDGNNVSRFVNGIASTITAINHFGISYSCTNIRNELAYYRTLVDGTSLTLFEESSDKPYERWFFIGNPQFGQNPLFEIVLTQSPTSVNNVWIPHFQIDINTSLDSSVLEKITGTLLARRFIRWKLNIPSVGVVLTMGILGNINGTKIVLGIGTSLRRRQELKELI